MTLRILPLSNYKTSLKIWSANRWKFSYILLPLLLFTSCEKEAPDPKDHIKTTLMSKGWRVEKYIFHFYDNREELELDSLSTRLLFSDSKKDDRKAITTDRWMVFDSDSSVRYVSSYDHYYRPKGETEWILDLKNNPSGGISEWGFNKNDSLYIFEPHISQIEILNEDCFIIKDEITIESSQPLPDNTGTLTIINGDYPAGTLKRIDVVYTAATADEGPPFFPPWLYWPE